MIRPARVAAVLVVAALVLGLAHTADRPGSSQLSSPPVTTVAASPTTAAPPEGTTSKRETTATRETSTSSAIRHDPVAVVSEGLAAWGEFGVGGDLATVEPWFWADGPQWSRFRQEMRERAEGRPDDPPYTVTVEYPQAVREGEEARVRARVRFIRSGEPTQSFDWVVVLRLGDDGWKIWTVEERQPRASSSPSMPIP